MSNERSAGYRARSRGMDPPPNDPAPARYADLSSPESGTPGTVATLEQLSPAAAGGVVVEVDTMPESVPAGQQLLIANEDLPFLGTDGIAKSRMFFASSMPR